MMRAKTIWGPDANEFNPDRWLDEKASAKLEPYYMPVRLIILSPHLGPPGMEVNNTSSSASVTPRARGSI